MIRSSAELRRFNYLVGEINALYHEAALKFGLSDSAMNILYAICDQGDGCLLRDICWYFGISKQTVNSSLRKLERDGIVYLEAHGGKQKRVYLTEQGKALSEATAARLIEMENKIFRCWPEESREAYLRLTQEYLTVFRQEIEGL